MRIHPIPVGEEARLLQACERGFVPCGTALPYCEEAPGASLVPGSGFAERGINRVLLGRALAGLLSRMRSFDWQVAHGHKIDAAAVRGALLDVRA